MSKNKKISFGKIEEIIKEYDGGTQAKMLHVGGEEVKIKIKHSLSLKEATDFINIVSTGCFTEIDGELSYVPYYKEFWLNCCLLSFYVENFKDDSNSERLYDFFMKTPIIQIILGTINEFQYKGILNSINEAIDFNKQIILRQHKSSLDELLDNINNIVLKLADKVEDVNFEDLEKYLPLLAGAIEKGSLDSEGVAKATLKALTEEEK